VSDSMSESKVSRVDAEILDGAIATIEHIVHVSATIAGRIQSTKGFCLCLIDKYERWLSRTFIIDVFFIEVLHLIFDLGVYGVI